MRIAYCLVGIVEREHGMGLGRDVDYRLVHWNKRIFLISMMLMYLCLVISTS